MGKIIAVGGGDIGLGETRKIDEFIVFQSRNKIQSCLLYLQPATIIKNIYRK